MENITLVMTETSNTYRDIMQMPYAAFLSIIKHIRINQLMQNPEWRDAYLKWQVKESYDSGNLIKQTKTDLQGLIAMQSGLQAKGVNYVNN